MLPKLLPIDALTALGFFTANHIDILICFRCGIQVKGVINILIFQIFFHFF